MKTIKFPDDGTLVEDRKGEGCIRHRDPLKIKFTESGKLFHDNPNAFPPYGIPMGHFDAGNEVKVGHVADDDQTVMFTFVLDAGNSVQYILHVQAPSKCKEPY